MRSSLISSTIAALALNLLAASWLAAQPRPRAPDATEHFETAVRPLLAKHCFACHGPDKQFAALRVDSRKALLAGGKSGPALVPGDPKVSALMRAVRGEQAQRMPLGGELAEHEISALAEWIENGAVWPQIEQAAAPAEDRYAELVRTHWAFQPVARTEPPALDGETWASHPVDRFLRSKLDERGLRPAPPADKATLLRRLTYALTGLPPTDDDVRQFVEDDSPDAYEQRVDRLLASPRFGEHWARYWLDLVRYGETRGYEWNYEVVGAWRYRDYLVRAFNQDVPFDQLVREHIAGDLLPNPRINEAEHINESVLGTAFYRLGEAGHDDCVKFRGIALDVIDNQIDVLSKTFQGLTVACARCHDHKLDPIPTVDYYGLYSVINSSRVTTHTIDTPSARADILVKLRGLKGEIRTEVANVWSRQVEQIPASLLQAIEEEVDTKQEETPTDAKPALGDPGYWLREIRRLVGDAEDYASAYRAAIERLAAEQKARIAANRKNFEALADFREAEPEGWSVDGLGLQDGPAPSGDFAVASSGEAALQGVYPAGLYTHTLSSRLNGAVRSPLLPTGRKLSFLALGGMLGARRTVIDNCAIGEDYAFLDSAQPEWVTVKLDAAGLPVFTELVTRWDNPRLPDRPGRVKEPQLELLDSPESYFGVVRAVLHDGDEPPADELAHLAALVEGDAPESWDELAERYQRIAAGAVERWAGGRSTDEDVRWIAWLLERGLLPNRADASDRLASLIERYRELESQVPEPRLVDGLEDAGTGSDFPVLLSGAANSPGEPAPRRFLSRLYGEQPLTREGSGRRELAELLASPENPLTSRVMVNRLWSRLFGRGIVASVDNFGTLGDQPSHPELLDFLARSFTDDGWSVRRFIRLLVTSEAFQQSGAVDPAAAETDPLNALLHHFSQRRLSAEEIRDTLLSVAGELQPEMYGESVDPYRKQPKDYRRLFAGPLLGDGRRSLYLKVTRMEGPAFLETFDFPLPASTRGVRDSTTVPAQSLALLNDPFVLEIAERCAERALASGDASQSGRLSALFRAILSRPPTPEETSRFAALADRFATLHEAPTDSVAVWRDLAHTLLNTKELLYVN